MACGTRLEQDYDSRLTLASWKRGKGRVTDVTSCWKRGKGRVTDVTSCWKRGKGRVTDVDSCWKREGV